MNIQNLINIFLIIGFIAVISKLGGFDPTITKNLYLIFMGGMIIIIGGALLGVFKYPKL
jgi:hypothetical protein